MIGTLIKSKLNHTTETYHIGILIYEDKYIIYTLHVLSNAVANVNFKVAAVLAVPASMYTESMII